MQRRGEHKEPIIVFFRIVFFRIVFFRIESERRRTAHPVALSVACLTRHKKTANNMPRGRVAAMLGSPFFKKQTFTFSTRGNCTTTTPVLTAAGTHSNKTASQSLVMAHNIATSQRDTTKLTLLNPPL